MRERLENGTQDTEQRQQRDELDALFELFLDRKPADRELVELCDVAGDGDTAVINFLFDHPAYRFKNACYPSDYVVPIEKNHPITSDFSPLHVDVAYRFLFGRTATDAELSQGVETYNNTRDFRHFLFAKQEFAKARFKRPNISENRLGPVGHERFHRAVADIAHECEEILDQLVDFVRYIGDRNWKAEVLAQKRIKISRLANIERRNIAIIVKPSYLGELDRVLRSGERNIRTFRSSQEFFDSDFCNETHVVVINNNFFPTTELQLRWRNYLKEPESPLGVLWSYDNHHSFANTIITHSIFDVIVPAHANYTDYLLTTPTILLPATPCGLAQWTPDVVMEGYEAFGNVERTDKLDGGYNLYFNRNAYRNAKIETISAGMPESNVRGVVFNEQRYWQNSDLDNLKEWMSHKTSVAIPVNNDLPIRVFDALAAGQIPLVPGWLGGFDSIISPALQRSLPIVKFLDYDVSEIRRAHRKALKLFDQGGAEGIKRRRDYCLNTHTLNHRYEEILTKIENLITIDS